MENKKATRALDINKRFLSKSKRSQEEIVGFALILIIVAVILLVLLAFFLQSPNKQSVESYQADSFVQSALQYTTDCADNYGNIDIKNLIALCNNENTCNDGRYACDVLKSTLKGIIENSWQIGIDRPVKGYEFNVTSSTKNVLSIVEGNETQNAKGSLYPFTKGDSFNVTFVAYYS